MPRVLIRSWREVEVGSTIYVRTVAGRSIKYEVTAKSWPSRRVEVLWTGKNLHRYLILNNFHLLLADGKVRRSP